MPSPRFWNENFQIYTSMSLPGAHTSTMHYSPFLQMSPNPHVMPHTQWTSHVGPEGNHGCRVRTPSPSLKLFGSVSSFPIPSWVGGDKGHQSVCRTGWLCLPHAPDNGDCRLLMEHSGFHWCQLQIEQPSSKQVQSLGAAQILLLFVSLPVKYSWANSC